MRFSSRNRQIRVIVLAFFLLSQTAATVFADGPIQAKLSTWIKGHGKRPDTARDGRLEDLASNVDWLEHHLNQWGSITAKAPDVWGEARLTQYRSEVETRLARELENFDPNRINGAQSVSDNAMLAAALSMKASAALPSGQTGIAAPPIQIQSTNPAPASVTTNTITLPNNFDNPNSLLGTATTSLGGTIGLEQTQVLDELNRYLQHLNELRRINEGDDTSDAPGYSLNLIRVPISILPGSLSKRGYGAEITMTAKPYLGPELLPMTFRELVTNDLIDQLALPLAKFLNSNPNRADRMLYAYQISQQKVALLRDFNDRYYERLLPLNDECISFLVNLGDDLAYLKNGRLNIQIVNDDDIRNVVKEIEYISSRIVATEKIAPESPAIISVQYRQNKPSTKTEGPTAMQYQSKFQSLTKKYGLAVREDAKLPSSDKEIVKELNLDLAQKLNEVFVALEDLGKIDQFLSTVGAMSITNSSSRRSQLPFPPTQIIDVFGSDEMRKLALAALVGFREDLPNKRVVHVSDCKSYLRDEVYAAMSLLYSETMQEWWASESSDQRCLHEWIRMRRTEQISAFRQRFIEFVQSTGRSDVTAGIAWAAFVDSILLNERLHEDIRETAGNRPSNLSADRWVAFYGPNPSDEARQLFADYTSNRWPIRVFTMDPSVDQQNIGDLSSVYRQMQMAVVLGVSGGNVGMNAAMNTLRKLQRDRATIDLNRTAVGFGHGDNTFGWRFRPRFQTPPVEGNAKVFFRDLIVGGPTDKQLERGLEMEPGIRECTAVVLMPSFVPFVTIETRSNWYKLNTPGHTAQTVKEDVELSRAVQNMKSKAHECNLCSHLYRDGELQRVLSRVEQLERRLPMQSIACQVPTENTHGGFEILSSGTRALAPELLGWYGGPGYDANRGASLFLSGDNFSIKQTQLVIGNTIVPAKNMTMLSRQIIQITLPPGLPILTDTLLQQHNPEGIFHLNPDNAIANDTKFDGYLDAHIATPYGVSSHLLIPAVKLKESVQAPAPATTSSFITKGGEFAVQATLKGKATDPIDFVDIVPSGLLLPAIISPKSIGIGTEPRDVFLYLSESDNRFFPIEFKDVRFDERTGGYQIAVNQLLNELKPTGSLFKSLESYIQFMQKSSGTLASDVVFDATYTIKNGGEELPVKGSFKCTVSLSPKAAK